MPRKPNYAFERHERDRAKATRLAQKADAKREERERKRVSGDDTASAPEADGASEATSEATSVPDEA
jgi:hypothetical protein